MEILLVKDCSGLCIVTTTRQVFIHSSELSLNVIILVNMLAFFSLLSSKACNVCAYLIESSVKQVLSCEECDKTFTNPIYLKRHKLTHTDELPFHCKHCSLAFRTYGARATHLSLAHTKEMFICDSKFIKLPVKTKWSER